MIIVCIQNIGFCSRTVDVDYLIMGFGNLKMGFGILTMDIGNLTIDFGNLTISGL